MANKKCAVGHRNCTGNGPYCIPEERAAQIVAQARSGTNWASTKPVGPACICGAGARHFTAAMALKGKYGRPTGFCPRHPGGNVFIRRTA